MHFFAPLFLALASVVSSTDLDYGRGRWDFSGVESPRSGAISVGFQWRHRPPIRAKCRNTLVLEVLDGSRQMAQIDFASPSTANVWKYTLVSSDKLNKGWRYSFRIRSTACNKIYSSDASQFDIASDTIDSLDSSKLTEPKVMTTRPADTKPIRSSGKTTARTRPTSDSISTDPFLSNPGLLYAATFPSVPECDPVTTYDCPTTHTSHQDTLSYSALSYHDTSSYSAPTYDSYSCDVGTSYSCDTGGW